ncbi:AI-2E family transporter [Sphingobium sufflavum]|uniref:AI-2E family transporter n=1 Tax=Sphingobium sufflavum TaxID=1129547 RepID=UPI001F34FEF1|nr:AI-2E family transporter [Sphingobium sufflavum]MCE7795732.1 AI-2E family transporter [Sphingobium sufflavum]
MKRGEDRFFVALVVGVTLALALIIRPFFGAILWALVAALMFEPLMNRLVHKLGGRRSLAASLTLLAIIVMVVVPALILGMFIAREVVALYGQISTGNLDINSIFGKFQALLPNWATQMLERYGLSDLDALRQRATTAIAGSFQTLAGQAFNISQSAFGFILTLGVMLYLAYFLLRDGQKLAQRIEQSIPLQPTLRRQLLDKVATVIRATIKGSLVVAILQGLIGGVIFWMLGVGGALLWGIAMGFLSLVPAIGTGLIWVPVAIYLLISGAIWQGIVLIACGILVIGMVDNVVRPVLVGRDTQMPDYVVLISTLGGLELFGFNGFVIGPVIAALFMAVWEIFAKARRRGTSGDAADGGAAGEQAPVPGV